MFNVERYYQLHTLPESFPKSRQTEGASTHDTNYEWCTAPSREIRTTIVLRTFTKGPITRGRIVGGGGVTRSVSSHFADKEGPAEGVPEGEGAAAAEGGAAALEEGVAAAEGGAAAEGEGAAATEGGAAAPEEETAAAEGGAAIAEGEAAVGDAIVH
jgi:hypothetical protein